MTNQILTLNLPEELYQRIKNMAERTQRTIEEETLLVLNTVVPKESTLTPELTSAMTALAELDDKALWKAARSHLPKKSSAKIESLHDKRRKEGLTSTEQQILEALLSEYERFMLIRAEAAVLLKARGFDISKLRTPLK